MSNLSRKETAALAAVIMVFACTLGWTLLRMAQSSAASGITLHEAFTQPPGGVPPGPPPVVSANAPSVASSPVGTSGPVLPVTSSGVAGQDTAEGGTASTSTPAGVTPAAVSSAEVVVHVAGAVHTPGVYHLPVGARNDEAIKKAGGPTADANTDGINLAARVEDGSQLFLPTRKQHPEGGADAPTNAPDAAASSVVVKAGSKTGAKGAIKAASAKGSGKSGKLSDPTQGKVNINTATVEELQRLPGIGPAMAERISEFRKQGGKFIAPEDLLQISGIGEKKFARMQPFVKVR